MEARRSPRAPAQSRIDRLMAMAILALLLYFAALVAAPLSSRAASAGPVAKTPPEGSLVSFSGAEQPIPGCHPCDPVTPHNGTVMHKPVNYLIFWLPNGSVYDALKGDAFYEQLIIQYFMDICTPNSFYGLLQQYGDPAPPGPCSYGGMATDNSTYPSTSLSDPQIQTEIRNVMAKSGWVQNNGNNEFFLFTGENVGYSMPGFCGEHNNKTVGGQQLTYAFVPRVSQGCYLADPYLFSIPVDNWVSYSELNLASHEQLESVSDPFWFPGSGESGWFSGPSAPGNETADKCSKAFPADYAGPTLEINGHGYVVQPEWSNRAGGCSYGSPSLVIPSARSETLGVCSGAV